MIGVNEKQDFVDRQPGVILGVSGGAQHDGQTKRDEFFLHPVSDGHVSHGHGDVLRPREGQSAHVRIRKHFSQNWITCCPKDRMAGFFILQDQEGSMSLEQNSRAFINDAIIKEIRDVVSKVAFGNVTITVHNKKITQIELLEKQRFDQAWSLEGGSGI